VELLQDVLLPRRQSPARAEIVLTREERVVQLPGRERRPRESVDSEEQRRTGHAAQEQGMPAADQNAERGAFSLCVAADSRSGRMARAAKRNKPEPAEKRVRPTLASSLRRGRLWIHGRAKTVDPWSSKGGIPASLPVRLFTG
jgi:hypothetical protein